MATRDRKLVAYRAKRRFDRTPEPAPRKPSAKRSAKLKFVVHRHEARRLHYDFRLEWQGVLRSWAVPRGLSTDPHIKRLAVEVEDHPLEYGSFEGVIPEGEYGAGKVEIWDRGTWTPEGDVEAGLREGKLSFTLSGKRLFGKWTLVRLNRKGESQRNWLLMKARSAGAQPSATEAAGRKRKRKRADAEPEFIEPQLATAVASAPETGRWFSELKLDGYRMLAHLDGAEVHCFSRAREEWTRRLPTVVRDLERLRLRDTWLDGELVAINSQGRATFQLLQQTLKSGDDTRLFYYVFDVLRSEGHDCRDWPLAERKVLLLRLLSGIESSDRVRLLEHSPGASVTVLEQVCEERAEGLILKQVDAPYVSGRTDTWLKLKCRREQEFVVGGYTRTQAGRDTLTSLLLGQYAEDGSLQYVGRVGSGFDEQMLQDLRRTLDRATRRTSPFDMVPAPRPGEKAVWCTPRLVAQVRFAGWTESGVLRQPLFLGLRRDLVARKVKRTQEPVVEPPQSPPARPAQQQPRLTHPTRVLFPEDGVTKAELAAYYAIVADWLWPHLADRPVSLLRTTENGQAFLQRHANASNPMPGVVNVPQPDGEPPYMASARIEALQSFAQYSCVELHTWSCSQRRMERADRLVFDLDPDPALPWNAVKNAALLVKHLLEALGLASFLKTTGGEGLHVVVPLSSPLPSWNESGEFSETVARHLTRTFPTLFSAKSGARNRNCRIYVDYLRNREGATTVSAYSPRLRAGAPVSMPVAWNDLEAEDLRAQRFNLRNAVRHIETRGPDPWAEYATRSQRLLKLHLRQLREAAA